MKYLTIILLFLIACQKETIKPMELKENVLRIDNKEITLDLHSIKEHQNGVTVSMSNDLFEALTFGTEKVKEDSIYYITDRHLPERFTNVRILDNREFDYLTQNNLLLEVLTFNDSIYEGVLSGTLKDTVNNISKMNIHFKLKK